MNLLLWHLHLYKCGFHIPEQNIPLSNIIDCLDESTRWSFSLHCFPRCFVLRIAITCMLPKQNETSFTLTHIHTNTNTHKHKQTNLYSDTFSSIEETQHINFPGIWQRRVFKKKILFLFLSAWSYKPRCGATPLGISAAFRSLFGYCVCTCWNCKEIYLYLTIWAHIFGHFHEDSAPLYTLQSLDYLTSIFLSLKPLILVIPFQQFVIRL